MEDFYKLENNQLALIPPFEHKETDDDDCGVPEDPIYANYSKYMWKGHRRTRAIEIGGPPRPLTLNPDDAKPSAY